MLALVTDRPPPGAAVLLIVGWALTRVLAVQMLLVAVASASFLA